MAAARDSRGWSRRDAALLLLSLVLTLFVVFLVLGVHRAAVDQGEAVRARVRADTAQHALLLGHFLGEHRSAIADLAASAEVTAFFENRALGMSMEYGLRQTLVVVGERFEAIRQRKRLEDVPVFSRLAFYGRDAGLLAESPGRPPGTAPPPACAATGLLVDPATLTLVEPVRFRGAAAGQVEGCIGLDLLRRILGHQPASGHEHSATLLVHARDLRVLLGEGVSPSLPGPAAAALRASPGAPCVAAWDDDSSHHLAVAEPVAGSPLVLVTHHAAERVLGSEPWQVLALLLLVSATLLGGTALLVQHMVRSRVLGARVAELEIRGELESARNRESLGREISARKQAEEQRAQLGFAVEQAAEAIIITDTAGVIQYVNPAFTAITGWQREEAVGRTPRLLRSGAHDQAFYQAMWGSLLAGRAWSGRLVNRHRDGGLVHEDATISPVRDGDGRIVRFVAVMRDVTALMRMEEQLRQAQKLESIGQLAAGIAHEINTPIQFIGDNLRFLSAGIEDLDRAIQGLAPLAEGRGDATAARAAVAAADLPYLKEELPRALSQSLEGVERVAVIVRAMKEFSHPGPQVLTPADLNRCIESTVTISRNEWKYVAEVELALDPRLPPVPLLAGDFNQVMLNLLVNAAHAIADRRAGGGGVAAGAGRIRISSALLGEQVEVRVADDGCGIPDRLKARIFEPFFTTKEVGRGTGQGLALARAVIVGKHGGTIRFESSEGVGTTFIIALPLSA